MKKSRAKKSKKVKSKKVVKTPSLVARIKVVGIGGGGGNATERISRDFIRGVEFAVINTDHQDLDHCNVREKVYIGRNLTRGLGTGMNPDLGRQAAEENKSEIAELLKGADIVFIAAGLGGGTGGGAAPVVAEVAKHAGALTVAVVTKPFSFEGGQRERLAQEALVKLKDKVDAIVVVPNDRIFTVISKDTPIFKAFEAIDDVLKNSLRGIVEMIATPGIINVDFADVRNIIQDAGHTIVGVGVASGADRAMNAVNLALNSPLLDTSAEGAKAVILGISGGRDLKMNEINDAAKVVAQVADSGARIIFGAYRDRSLKPNQIKVTLIATGFNGTPPNSLFSGTLGEDRQVVLGGLIEEKSSGKNVTKSIQQNASARKNSRLTQKESEMFSGELAGSEEKMTKGAEKTEEEKKENDVWDIPTFLRRRKK